jgi:hypothetical protein
MITVHVFGIWKVEIIYHCGLDLNLRFESCLSQSQYIIMICHCILTFTSQFHQLFHHASTRHITLNPYHSAYSDLSKSGRNFIDISDCLDDVGVGI